jgi:hypothetical protein
VPDEDRLDARSSLGLAYRQTDNNVLNALARYENRWERLGGGAPYRKVANIVSTHANVRPWAPLTLNGQLAAKWRHYDALGIETSTRSALAAGRAIYDMTDYLDLGVAARELMSGGRQFGLGGEIGVTAAPRIRFALGYNVFGFQDPDMTGVDRTDEGLYFDIGWKFDETFFNRKGRSQ